MRRIVLVLTVALVMAAMMALTVSQAFAGNGPQDNKVGDQKNNVANPQCDPFDRDISKNERGSGCENR